MENQKPADPQKVEEVPLDDLDKLLTAEDPQFVKQLEEVKAVKIDPTVEIESAAVVDQIPDGKPDEKSPKDKPSLKYRVRAATSAMFSRLGTALGTLRGGTIVFLKTKPKEFLFYSYSVLKMLLKQIAIPFKAYQTATTTQKRAVLAIAVLFAASIWLIKANLKGIWLPALNEPLLQTMESYSDWVETYNPREQGESFYSAFPQERYEFLFRKFKVNLKQTSENPNPMGAFEILILLDSKDTAIEVRDREVEFFDLLQRVFEDESVTDLDLELGKSKLKGRMKRELNQKLTQGWVKDVNFKTFILKP